MACTHIAGKMGTVPAESRPPDPETSLCIFVIAPDFPSRLERTLSGYCAANPAQPIENALDLYWDESLKKGTFD